MRPARCHRSQSELDSLRIRGETHTVLALIGQRIFGIALGCEEINDHDLLRHDPVLQALRQADDLWAQFSQVLSPV
jgi:hypothetical protein